MFKPVCQQEPVRRNTQGGVMMKATPVSSLVVAQAELLFCCRVMTIKDVAQETHLDWKTIKELAKQ